MTASSHYSGQPTIVASNSQSQSSRELALVASKLNIAQTPDNFEFPRSRSERLKHKIFMLKYLDSADKLLPEIQDSTCPRSCDIALRNAIEVRLWTLAQKKILDPKACRKLRPLDFEWDSNPTSQQCFDYLDEDLLESGMSPLCSSDLSCDYEESSQPDVTPSHEFEMLFDASSVERFSNHKSWVEADESDLWLDDLDNEYFENPSQTLGPESLGIPVHDNRPVGHQQYLTIPDLIPTPLNSGDFESMLDGFSADADIGMPEAHFQADHLLQTISTEDEYMLFDEPEDAIPI
ncbi:uncharacterized protein KY384_006880 [Bacidia gigantensis]|uniref:uncharacterized protein n=1 Tax=Bacidia gigantensis TaxID=2732470 RepID=UPI001D043B7B|nr:uncharacterized protein KY384_006880 [Bacidia gigantensis]KAG8527964.1 hypothetical protein KY384_006880 [Bacidia gigantensis]